MQAAIIFIIFSLALQKFLFEGKVDDNSGMLRPENKYGGWFMYMYDYVCICENVCPVLFWREVTCDQNTT